MSHQLHLQSQGGRLDSLFDTEAQGSGEDSGDYEEGELEGQLDEELGLSDDFIADGDESPERQRPQKRDRDDSGEGSLDGDELDHNLLGGDRDEGRPHKRSRLRKREKTPPPETEEGKLANELFGDDGVYNWLYT